MKPNPVYQMDLHKILYNINVLLRHSFTSVDLGLVCVTATHVPHMDLWAGVL